MLKFTKNYQLYLQSGEIVGWLPLLMMSLYSNHGNADHTLVSCSPVSLRDQLTVKLVKKKGEGEEEKDEFVSNISVLSGESIQISIEIIAK